MKPTVGRIVHFYQESHTDRGGDAQPLAAIVTRQNADGTVNLHVFHHGDTSSASANGRAANVVEGDPAVDKRGRLWCWPPREPLTPADTAPLRETTRDEPPADAGAVPADPVATEGDGFAPAEATDTTHST